MSKRNYTKPTVQMIRLDVKASVLASCFLSSAPDPQNQICNVGGADCANIG